MKNVAVFEDAARTFLDVLGRITPAQWNSPGLGVWTVRSLAGHTARAISTVGEYLSSPAPDSAQLTDAEEYFLSLLDAPMNSDDIAARGVLAAAALGDDPHSVVAQSLDRALSAIAAQPANRIVSVVGGKSIPLTEYLRTRSFELVVHTIDLSRATGLTHYLPERAVSDAAKLAAGVASRRGNGDTLLLAMTGRAPLPEGFSVV